MQCGGHQPTGLLAGTQKAVALLLNQRNVLSDVEFEVGFKDGSV